jgi:hypothetical protein
MKIYLHIGLPKTATTFLQEEVFPQITDPDFIYNPPDIMEYISSFLRFDPSQKYVKETHQKEISQILQSYADKNILLSAESMSVDPWTFNRKNCAILSQLLPQAEIILFLRQQTDWVRSMYRFSVKKGTFITARQFLGYNQGTFSYTNPSFRWRKTTLNVPAIRFDELIQEWSDRFGKEHIHIFFFENLADDPQKTMDSLFTLLGVATEARPEIDFKKKINVSATYKTVRLQSAIYNLGGLLLRWHNVCRRDILEEKSLVRKTGRAIVLTHHLACRKVLFPVIERLFSVWLSKEEDPFDEELRSQLNNYFLPQNEILNSLSLPEEGPASYF